MRLSQLKTLCLLVVVGSPITFTFGAERDEVMSQYQLAARYCQEAGVPQNHDKALKLLRTIANQGDSYFSPMAALDLANHNRRGGCGFSKNILKAVSWYKKCAKQGDSIQSGMASQILAVMYHKGKEIPMDLVKAGAWAIVSVAQGNSNAKMTQRIIALDLTGPQRIQAEKLANRLLRLIPLSH